MEKVEKEIKWEWEENWGRKFDGTYKGELKDNIPHGIGKWKQDDGNITVEGEWKEGLLNGKAIANWNHGSRYEYEVKDGKLNGKWI